MPTPKPHPAIPDTASPHPASPDTAIPQPRFMLPVLCTAAFLVFVQTFMVAPLLPRLSVVFASSVAFIGLAIPAYVVPQGITTLLSGPLSDRFGRRTVIFASLSTFVLLLSLTATASSAGPFILWRIITGICAAGIVPIGLSLIGDVVPFARRGRAVGWLFGAIAGGTAAGAALGALLEPLIGWRALFLLTAALCAALVLVALLTHAFPKHSRPRSALRWRETFRGYARLLAHTRAQRTYAYVLLNAVLQSGVFTWLGLYLHTRYQLSVSEIGWALLGYGVPGFLFGPIIGKLSDRIGRARIIPTGIAITGLCALLLVPQLPLFWARVAIVLLSLGFDLTHPLLAAITTDLEGERGQTVAVMAFSLFGGFGLGSLLFEAVLPFGFPAALLTFGTAALLAAGLASHLFRKE